MPAYAAASRRNRYNLNVRTGSPKQLESFNSLWGHTWANWKLYWTAAFAKMRDISRMTTGDTTFGANQAAEIEQSQQMATSLDNLANASCLEVLLPLA